MKEKVVKLVFDNYRLWELHQKLEELSSTECRTLDEAWDKLYDEDLFDWGQEKDQLDKFFKDKLWIVWNSKLATGGLFISFKGLLKQVVGNSACIRMFSSNDRFCVECMHGGDADFYEVRRITRKGSRFLKGYDGKLKDSRRMVQAYNEVIEQYTVYPDYNNCDRG